MLWKEKEFKIHCMTLSSHSGIRGLIPYRFVVGSPAIAVFTIFALVRFPIIGPRNEAEYYRIVWVSVFGALGE